MALGALSLLVTSWSEAEAQQILYAVGDGRNDQQSDLYRIDDYTTSTPQAVVIGDTGHLMCDIAVEPGTGRLFAIDCDPSSPVGTSLYELNPGTGLATKVGELGTFNQAGLEFDVLGRLWAWGDGVFSELSQVDPNSGTVVVTYPMNLPATGDMAYSVDGRLYGTINSWLVTLDAPFGGQNGLHQRTGQSGFHGLEIDSNGRMYALKDASSYPSRAALWSIDPDTGTTKEIGPIGGMDLGARGLAFTESRGFMPYGQGLGTQKLSMRWLPDPLDARNGNLLITGVGQPQPTTVWVGWSTGPSQLPLGPTFVLLDLAALQLVTVGSGAQGQITVPGTLGPVVLPIPLFVQAFEIGAGTLDVSAGLGVR